MSRTIIKVPIEYLPVNSKNIPLFLPIVCSYIKSNASTVGIFRIPGSKDQVLCINESLAQHVPSLPQNSRTSDVASFLKLWLLDLPTPLIQPEIFNQYFLSQTIGCIYSLVDHLPTPNRRSLALIISMLKVLIQHSDENKMTMKNLATCFVPALTQSFKKLKKTFPFSFIINSLISILNETETDFVTPRDAVNHVLVESKTAPTIAPRHHRDSLRFHKDSKHRRARKENRMAGSLCLSPIVF